jgi:glycine betaine/proline transport system permease protein
MAIIFDRLSLAMGRPRDNTVPPNSIKFHLLPQSWDIHPWAMNFERFIGIFWNAIASAMGHVVALIALVGEKMISPLSNSRGKTIGNFLREHNFLIGSVVILAVIWFYDAWGPGIGEFPESWSFTFREPVDNAVAWLTVNPTFIAFTKGMRYVIYIYMLNPLDTFLTHLPWYVVIAILGLVSWVSVGRTFGIVCISLLFFIGACDLWTEAMLTLSSVLVSVFICFVFGLPLGILAAQNKRFDMFLRPILDTMQTLPAFVYLIPVLMFFGGNIVSAVIATVIYALPPVIRLTTLGISQIPVTYTEVSSSFGGTSMQTLAKVKLPMALPSIMLGLNQAVMMALAMQVVTPLIGGGGLGRDVFNALNTSNTGYGLAAGIGIVLLAIILDRLSQAWTQTQRKALGL